MKTAKTSKHEVGTIVEIAGSANVEVNDRWGKEKTDHKGALARVEGHYDSATGERKAWVRTPDNRVRGISEDRLRDTGARRTSVTGGFGPSPQREVEPMTEREFNAKRLPSSYRGGGRIY